MFVASEKRDQKWERKYGGLNVGRDVIGEQKIVARVWKNFLNEKKK